MEKIIKLDRDNISSEHICCAIADKKCLSGYNKKKEWLQQQFSDGLVFKKLDVRGKVFIEYIPAEKAWAPVDAPDYMMINCFWVSGQYQGKGYGKQLYQECLKDTEGKNGIVVITSAKKQPFLNDKKFFQKQGFELADKAEPYFELWYKKLKKDAPLPKFKDIAKNARCNISKGLSVYYTHGCPFTEYYVNNELVNVAKAKGYEIKVVKIESR
jgi:N-acetylglutamate synthase-like GNAT family acetyltransferase